MNDGARQAKKEVLVFLDADALVTRGWLRGLVAALGEDFAASTGKYVPAERTLVSLAGEMSQVLENEARGRVILQGSGGIAVRRAAFEAIAGIPEGRYADDWALSTLLEQKGYKLAYAPDALLFSERPASLREWWRNELRWRRMHLLTLFRVGSGEPRNPLSVVKALYPYVTAWSAFALSAVTIVAGVARLQIRGVAQAAWAAVGAIALAREMAGAVETAAYTGQAKWLRTGLIIPVLTGLHWGASTLATLTTCKARLHFKGPRHDVPKVQPELLAKSSAFPVVETKAQVEVAQ